MEARYAFRKTQLLAECQVAPEIFAQLLPRLSTLLKPFVKTFHGQAPAQHAQTYVCGLLSDLERKNVESIAGDVLIQLTLWYHVDTNITVRSLREKTDGFCAGAMSSLPEYRCGAIREASEWDPAVSL